VSDVSQGEGWWQASDYKWYPPETHPQYVAPSASTDPPTESPPSVEPEPEPEPSTGSLEFGSWPSLPSDLEPTTPPPDPLAAPQPSAPPPAPGQVAPPVLPPAQYPPIDPGYPGAGPQFPPAGPPPGWIPNPVPPTNTTNGLAIASLVLGIVWLAGIGSILAVVFGFVARKQIRARHQSGNGMALAGIILGWIGVGVLILAIIGAATSSSSNNQTVKLTVITYGRPCASSLFSEGTTKVVASNRGTQLATTNLNHGADGSASLNSGSQVSTCTYSATMVLKNNLSGYTFMVGGNHPLTFSRSEMENDNWHPGITFGCPSDLQGGC
jgi:hypothetical protein